MIDWDYIEELDYGTEFDDLLGHCSFIERILQAEKEKLSTTYKKSLEKRRKRQKLFSQEYFENNFFLLYNLFPSIQWAAMFVISFNLFEKTLNDICKFCEYASKSKIKLKDFRGRGIERAKLYLKKVHDIADPFNNGHWERIKIYSKIRNLFSHAYGDLDLTQKDHSDILKFAEIEEGITIKNHDTNLNTANITITKDIVFQSITIYRQFTDLLISEIAKK